MDEKQLFDEIHNALSQENEGITTGKMLVSTGIQYQGKNFAFLYQNSMVFRLGRDFDPESEGIHKYQLFNPFKNKPALKDWFVVSSEYSEKWLLLAQVALAKMK